MLSFSEEGEDREEETGLSPVTLYAHVVWPHSYTPDLHINFLSLAYHGIN